MEVKPEELVASEEDEGSVVDESEPRTYEFKWAGPPESADENIGVYSIEALASGGLLVAVGGDERVHLLQLLAAESLLDQDGILRGLIEELPQPDLPKVHTDSLSIVTVSDDRQCIAVGGVDGRVSVYDVEDAQRLRLLKVLEDSEAEIESLSFAPKSRALLGSASDGQAFTWHASKGFVSCFTGHKGRVPASAFAPFNGKTACITVGVDGYLCVWEPQTGQCTVRIEVVYEKKSLTVDQLSSLDTPHGINCLDIMSDNPIALCGCANGEVVLVNYEIGQVVKRLPSLGGVVEFAKFAGSNSREAYGDLYLAACDSEGNIGFATISNERWRVRTNFYEKNDMLSAVTQLLWHNTAHDAKVVCGAADGVIKIYECRSGKCLDTLGGGADSVSALKLVQWTDDLTLVAAGTEEGQVLIWQLD